MVGEIRDRDYWQNSQNASTLEESHPNLPFSVLCSWSSVRVLSHVEEVELADIEAGNNFVHRREMAKSK